MGSQPSGRQSLHLTPDRRAADKAGPPPIGEVWLAARSPTERTPTIPEQRPPSRSGPSTSSILGADRSGRPDAGGASHLVQAGAVLHLHTEIAGFTMKSYKTLQAEARKQSQYNAKSMGWRVFRVNYLNHSTLVTKGKFLNPGYRLPEILQNTSFA